MTDRLGPRPGEWIDRTKTVRFSFEGREVSGYRGDTLSSALWAAGVRATGRSFKYHRPRGICSMANHDVNNMFMDGTRTNIRADVTPARDAAMIPSVPWACAATRRPCIFASSTIAFISASESCCAPTGPSNESTPAVAQILITLAPCLIW